MTADASPTLVVLAAGASTRFGSPKQLVPVGPSGEALLDYALFDATRAGFRRAVVVVRGESAAALRAHLAHVVGDALPVRFVEQERPWGTGHAVLAAASAVQGPFAVCNADDFYGAGAYRQLFDHFGRDRAHAMVAYRLHGTLSPHGGVSRAAVEQDANGFLVRLTEIADVTQGPAGIRGTGPGGSPVTLVGDQLVSMNLWGFTPALFPALEQLFHRFRQQREADPGAEFRLSEAVDAMVSGGAARVRVLVAQEYWCGVTVAADVDLVRQAIGELVAGGVYPPDLRVGFQNR